MTGLDEALELVRVSYARDKQGTLVADARWAGELVYAAATARSHQPPLAIPAPSYYGYCWSCSTPGPDYWGGDCKLCTIAEAIARKYDRPFRFGPVPPGRSTGKTPSKLAPPRRTARTRKSQQMALKVGT